MDYPYAFHIALDGNGINGLEGLAGACLFLYDPASGNYAHKVKFYDGIGGGHAVSVNPTGTVGFVGNTGQHLLFYDAATLEEIDRISTLRFEGTDSSIRGSTHVVWLSEHEFITVLGDWLYRFDLNDLSRPERLGEHGLAIPHAMKRSRSGRHVVIGSMDHPRRGEAREVGILDLESMEVTRLELPATCWHVAAHPTKDLFYAITFRVKPQAHRDWHQWGMAFFKEYAFEIDPIECRVTRHWTAGREIPNHINSDVTISDSELIWCNGGSGTIMMVELEELSGYRYIDERPDAAAQVRGVRQAATQVYDVMSRGGVFASSQDFFAAMRISRGVLFDSVHACKLSKDQKLLFTANRGLNHITIYDYGSNATRLRVPMPELREYVPHLGMLADPRLGFHHGHLVSPS